MNKVISAPSTRHSRQTNPICEELSLEQARNIVADLEHVSRETLIDACRVIERHGTVSERADFRALRRVIETQEGW